MKILVTGGGTGGHVTPILAVLQRLRDKVPDLEVSYLIDENDDSSLIHNKRIIVREIKAGKFRRYSGRSWLSHVLDPSLLIKNLRDFFRVLYGIVQSIKIIRQFGPDTIFIKGGYVGVPVGIAAGLLGVPYIIHDSDVVPGLANKILAPRAQKIAVGFHVQYYNYPSKKVVYTGNPVRKEFVQNYNPKKIRAKFNISNQNPVILVVGGSSGAKRINEIIKNLLDDLLRLGNVIHITGPDQPLSYNSENNRHKNTYQSYDFIHNFYEVLFIASVVISRAGASSIAEIAAMEKPAIFIPHPHLTGEHQIKNAQAVKDKNAGVVLQQKEILNDPSLLLSRVKELLTEKGSEPSKNLGAFYKHDSADKLAHLIIEEANSAQKKK